MGDLNQFLWVKNNRPIIKSPILEIGSKFYASHTSMNYRDLFSDVTYVGTDMEQGENVDKVVDFTNNFDSIAKELGTTFNTVICCSVMEHVKDIYSFASNVSKILNPGGILVISVPFTWEYHGYPDDYWRFTPSAIKFLYPEFDFSIHEHTISSSVNDDLMQMKHSTDLNSFLLKENIYAHFEGQNRGIFRLLKKTVNLIRYPRYRKEFIIRKMLGTEYRLSLSCINMIGVKR